MTERIIQAIDEQDGIGRVADTLQPAVRATFRALGPELKDVLHGKWLGHPLHPVLVSLPIGAWTLAFLCDVAEVMRGKKSGLAEAAISVGLAGAVASAVTGLADWSETDGRGKKIGVVHATLNVTATALYAASLGTRKRSRPAGIGLSLLAFGLANAGAYLGGHLSFGEQIGVNHTEAPTSGKPENFVAVLKSGELADNAMVRVLAEGVSILLVRRNGRIFAIAETCTHLGGPLSEGKLEGDTVQCPWHGSRFCIEDGRVDRGPATFPVRKFEVREREGSIEVRAAQA